NCHRRRDCLHPLAFRVARRLSTRRAWARAIGEAGSATGPRFVPARRAPRLRPVRGGPLTLERLIADIMDRDARDAAVPERQEFAITATPKPRMTQADRWLKRPPVLRYRAFCDEIRLKGAKLPSRYRATFVLPMPPSWP